MRPDSNFEMFSKNKPSTKVWVGWCCGIIFHCNTVVLMKFISRTYICMCLFCDHTKQNVLIFEIFTLFFRHLNNKLIFFYFSVLVWTKYFFLKNWYRAFLPFDSLQTYSLILAWIYGREPWARRCKKRRNIYWEREQDIRKRGGSSESRNLQRKGCSRPTCCAHSRK